eukprot:jgi/Chlat1/6225/Chrsp44S09040
MAWAAVSVILLFAALLFVLLFGQAEAFRRTPLPRVHAFITGGGCLHAQRCIAVVFGKAGDRCLEHTEDLCCGRPNPLLQARGLYTAPLLVTVCLVLFFLACWGDAGTITHTNVRVYAAMYPYDEFQYTAKMVCMYGAYLMAAALAGAAKHRGLLDAVYADEDGQHIAVADSYGFIIQWFLHYYSTPALLALFCGMAALVVFAFTAQQMWLVARNVTTSESFKQKDYKDAYAAQQRAIKAGVAISMEELLGPFEHVYDKGLWKNLQEAFWPPSKYHKCKMT